MKNEPLEMVERIALQRRLAPVLFDQACGAADTWDAVTTPHAFVVDIRGILRYRGAVYDASFRRQTPETFLFFRRYRHCCQEIYP